MTINDLEFIDLGLPSGKKICVQLINNLYKCKDLITSCFELLPTTQEIREIMLFCDFVPTTKEIYADEEEEVLLKRQDGLDVIGPKNRFFLPLLGTCSLSGLSNENDKSWILTYSFSYPEILSYAIIDRLGINFATDINEDYYVQTLLVDRR